MPLKPAYMLASKNKRSLAKLNYIPEKQSYMARLTI